MKLKSYQKYIFQLFSGGIYFNRILISDLLIKIYIYIIKKKLETCENDNLFRYFYWGKIDSKLAKKSTIIIPVLRYPIYFLYQNNKKYLPLRLFCTSFSGHPIH